MTRVQQHYDAGKGVRILLARCLLLVAVIAGVLALHVLTAEDQAPSSGQFAGSVTAQLTPALDRAEAVPDAGTRVGAVREPVGPAQSLWVAGCMLFVTVAASVGLARLLVLLRRRRPADPSIDRAKPGERGQPEWVVPVLLPPRLAAGVIRV